MDFSQFDQRGRAEAGTPHPIIHPWTGQPVVNTDSGQPCFVLVRSKVSPTVVAAWAAVRRSQMTEDEPPKDQTAYEADDYLRALAAPCIAGFQNVFFDGRPATEADADTFLRLIPPLRLGEDGQYMPAKTFAVSILEIVNSERDNLGNAPAP